MEPRELAGIWRELEQLEERVSACEARVDELDERIEPFERGREDVIGLLTFTQKLAGFAVVVCAVGSFVLQAVHG